MKKSTFSFNFNINKTLLTLCFIVLCLLISNQINAAFVHPGMSHKKSDLERMKYMVETGKDPWMATYKLMQANSSASYNYNVNGSDTITSLTNYGAFTNDGVAAYYNALMWSITGDVRHAQKCVEIFNAWVNLKSVSNTMSLWEGRPIWKMLEAAEIIKSTYTGWAQSDIDKFKAMLVYPGYSTTVEPTAVISSKNVTFYWSMYNGDPGRHGNQGLFGIRGIMAMGIFMDNEIMYDRALRYLQGLPHRADDLPYPSGPPVTSGIQPSSNEYYEEYSLLSRGTSIQDYGYNEVISNYIYENGQGQESARDQAHGLGGVSIITEMCEMAWNQGDDLYGHLDNRPLLGLEFYFRYNLSYENQYPDQLTPWEPTIESGEFIKRSDRSGRWTSLKINPYMGADLSESAWNRGKHNLNGIYEMNLGHYKDRMMLDSTKYKWLKRGFEYMTKMIGVEDNANPVDHPGWGGIKFRRLTPGDPISGFNGTTPVFAMNVLPTTIEAENYDHFAINGEGRTYHDLTETNTANQYRTTEGVDIQSCSEGGYNLTDLASGEWLTYTVYATTSGLYDITIRYAASTNGGKIKFSFDGKESTDELNVPFGDENSNGIDNWKSLTIAKDVILAKGVQCMKISISGVSNAFVLNNISIAAGAVSTCSNSLAAVTTSDRITKEINYSYYEGTWTSMPTFTSLTPLKTGFSNVINQDVGGGTNHFALMFSGYIYVSILGNYSFFTNSNGASRLYIDGTLVVNNDGTNVAMEQSGNVCLAEGFHLIKVEYLAASSDKSLLVNYSGPGVTKRELSDLYGIGDCTNLGTAAPSNIVPGLTYKYYEGTWSLIPNFAALTPVKSGITSTVSLSNKILSDYYGFVFEGYINIAKSGDYIFYTTSDDGSSLWIDDVKIVSNDGTHGSVEKSGATCLGPGYHKIKIEYFDKTGSSDVLTVKYEGAGIAKTTLSGYYTTQNSGTGISNLSQDLASIFPNPVTNSLTVELKNDDFFKYELYTLSGSKIIDKNINGGVRELSINFSDYPKGTYLLMLKAKNCMTPLKVIK